MYDESDAAIAPPQDQASPCPVPARHVLAAMLDEVDVPMLLVDTMGALVLANRAARHELETPDHPLRIEAGKVCARSSPAARAFDAEFSAALRGAGRRVLSGAAGGGAGIGVIPIVPAAGEGGGLVLLSLGRRQLCPPLTIDWFARQYALTSSESQILSLLCAGLRPRSVAQRQGVAVSTVRTHIRSIRAKTVAASTGELVARVALMPPMIGLLKSAA